MNSFDIISNLYPTDSLAYRLLVSHSRHVAELAVRIARYLNMPEHEVKFIDEASMLHDIGILHTNAPGLGCTGLEPYICHGVLGSQILRELGHDAHAQVAECHVGMGITIDDIRKHGFLLPEREMVPVSMAERIICYADKFYSKNGTSVADRKSLQVVRDQMASYGEGKLEIFDAMHMEFGAGL